MSTDYIPKWILPAVAENRWYERERYAALRACLRHKK
jgi:hypothetical protein